MASATERLGQIRERMERACRRSGRKPQDVTLVAVTKTVSFEKVLPFLQAGVTHVGENRVQEAMMKYQSPEGARRTAAQLHLIGRLQRNKAKKAAAFFDLIESLDRLDLAEDLHRHAQALGRRLPCLIEVKISPEETKAGVPPERLEKFLGRLRELAALDVQGLMAIAPYAASLDEARPYFARMRGLFEKTKLAVLSMGMSADFEAAIEEGSTMVRIGTALFGPRVSGPS